MMMEQLPFDQLIDWPIPKRIGNSTLIDTLNRPIWTETKAKLVQQYLRFFLYITRHGTYIDGFAGPQDPDNPDSWAAKLVLEMDPKWLRNFYFCELNKNPFNALESMIKSQPNIKNRNIEYKNADVNNWIHEILSSGRIDDNEATFALLDQHSFECHWQTVQALANHRKGNNKIELFYFFPTGWLFRSISGVRDKSILDKWWGDNTWTELKDTGNNNAAALHVSQRFRDLGYKDVMTWPIYQREDGEGRVMYHMVHATDHPEAPKLMWRAYTNLVATPQEQQQIEIDFKAFLEQNE